jgi:uncharacterized protein YndB with AHSA1/START domain
MTDTAAEHQILVERIFAAPREEVFRAWTDPEEIAAWYGPAAMSVPADRANVDAHTGVRWELTMIPDGGGDGFSIGYDIVELVAPELLVLRSDPMPQMGMPDGTTVRVELHEHDRGTRMILTDGPLPAHGRDRAEAGYLAAFDKLEARMRAKASGST